MKKIFFIITTLFFLDSVSMNFGCDVTVFVNGKLTPTQIRQVLAHFRECYVDEKKPEYVCQKNASKFANDLLNNNGGKK